MPAKGHQGGVKLVFPQIPRKSNVMGAAAFSTSCFSYREQGVCNIPDECPHVHESRTGVQCIDPEFELTGLCAKFKKCLDEHKFDEAKFGPIKDAMAKHAGASPKRMALKYAGIG